MSNSGGMYDGYLANIVDVLRKSENVEDEWNTLRLAEIRGQGKTKQLTKSVPFGVYTQWLWEWTWGSGLHITNLEEVSGSLRSVYTMGEEAVFS